MWTGASGSGEVSLCRPSAAGHSKSRAGALAGDAGARAPARAKPRRPACRELGENEVMSGAAEWCSRPPSPPFAARGDERCEQRPHCSGISPVTGLREWSWKNRLIVRFPFSVSGGPGRRTIGVVHLSYARLPSRCNVPRKLLRLSGRGRSRWARSLSRFSVRGAGVAEPRPGYRWQFVELQGRPDARTTLGLLGVTFFGVGAMGSCSGLELSLIGHGVTPIYRPTPGLRLPRPCWPRRIRSDCQVAVPSRSAGRLSPVRPSVPQGRRDSHRPAGGIARWLG